MTIEFGPCPACGKWPPKPEEAKPEWAVLAGWDGCIRWIRDELDTPPVCGHVRQIAVSYPFRGEAAEPFWCLWAPFEAYEIGYQEFPEQLQQSRVVEVRLQEVLATEIEGLNGKTATALVEVLRCLSYSELVTMPQREERGLAGMEWLRDVKPTACSDELCFAEMNLEGDMGSWAVWTNKESVRHLLLEGTWGRHENYFFAENLLI